MEEVSKEVDEVEAAIKSHHKKAAGSDHIQPEHLQYGGDLLAPQKHCST